MEPKNVLKTDFLSVLNILSFVLVLLGVGRECPRGPSVDGDGLRTERGGGGSAQARLVP
jgi:hypothetical protein